MLDQLAANFQSYLNASPALALGACFVLGLAASLTPCSYPLLPITVAYIGGGSAGKSRLTGFVLSLFYVLGMGLTYAVLGVVSALANKVFGFTASNPIIMIIIGALFVVFGLSMMDVFQLPMPQALTSLQPKKRTGPLGAFIVGVGSGFIAMPCSTPILLTILTHVFQKGGVAYGFILLFAYALGFGVLFIIVGTSAGAVTSLPTSGPWMVWVKRIAGLAIIVFGLFYVISAVTALKKPAGAKPEGKFIPVQNEKYIQEKIGKKPLFLVFYNSWCKTCAEEVPHLNELYKEYAPKGLAFYGVNINDPEGKARAFIEKTGVEYPVIWDAGKTRVAEAFDILGTPTIMIYDAAGKLIHTSAALDKKTIEQMNAALAGTGKAGARDKKDAGKKHSVSPSEEPRVSITKVKESPVPGAREIKWRAWGKEAFEQAAEDNRPVLLSLWAPWNHASVRMDQRAFKDPAAVKFVNEHFIPVRVDPLTRPDIAARYGNGALPVTAFLTPGGVVMKLHNELMPAPFLDAAAAAAHSFDNDRATVDKRAAEVLAQLEQARPAPGKKVPENIPQKMLERLEKTLDPEGPGMVYTSDLLTAAEFLLLEHSRTASPRAKKALKRVLADLLEVADSEWGGLFSGRAGGELLYEKLLTDNARALCVFLDAHRAFGSKKYLTAAADTYRYMEGFLARGDDNGFHAAQAADMWLDEVITGKAYYALPDKERSDLGMPPREKTYLTGAGALAASSYFKLYAVLGWQGARKKADRVLEHVWDSAYTATRGVSRTIADGKPAGGRYLDDQAAVMAALLDAYEATADSHWLARAVLLATDVQSRFSNPDGEFRMAVAGAGDIGYLAFPVQQPAANAQLARCFLRLRLYTGKEAFKKQAHNILAALSGAWDTFPDADAAAFAHAATLFLNNPLEMVVLGKKSNPKFRDMLLASHRFYEPNKVILPLDQTADADRLATLPYEPLPHPALFACVVDQACARPVSDPAQVASKMQAFTARFMKNTALPGPALNKLN